MKKRIIYFLVIIQIALLCACKGRAAGSQNGEADSFDPDVPITVYMASEMAHASGDQTQENAVYYHSYRVGECWNSSYGKTIYNEAIDAFSAKYHLPVHVLYFESQYVLEKQLKEDFQNNNLPDLVICDAAVTQNVYALIQEGGALDLAPYLTEREADYAEVVMEACREGKEQYVLPLLYNMNALYTTRSKSEASFLGVQDALLVLEEEMNRLWQQPDVKEVLYAVPTGNPVTVNYIFWNALGYSRIDLDTGALAVEEEKLRALAEFGKRYQEFEKDFTIENQGDKPNRSSYLSSLLYENYFIAPSAESAQSLYKDYSRQISYWLDGVSGCNWPAASMAIQTQYYASQLQADGQELALIPISAREDRPAYNAAITLFGFVCADSENPLAAVELLKYLQDYEADVRYGFSVNQEVTKKQLIELTTTEWEIHNFNVNSHALGTIQPLSKALAEQIYEIIQQVETASLPNGSLEIEVLYPVLQEYYKGADWEACYRKLQETAQLYIEMKWQ